MTKQENQKSDHILIRLGVAFLDKKVLVGLEDNSYTLKTSNKTILWWSSDTPKQSLEKTILVGHCEQSKAIQYMSLLPHLLFYCFYLLLFTFYLLHCDGPHTRYRHRIIDRLPYSTHPISVTYPHPASSRDQIFQISHPVTYPRKNRTTLTSLPLSTQRHGLHRKRYRLPGVRRSQYWQMRTCRTPRDQDRHIQTQCQRTIHQISNTKLTCIISSAKAIIIKPAPRVSSLGTTKSRSNPKKQKP